MSTANSRRKRCINAIESTLGFVRKKDAPEAVKRLEERFLGPAAILEASPYQLHHEGLTASEAQLLSLIPGLARYSKSRDFGLHPKLAVLSAASEFLKARFIGVNIEQFHALCLDGSGKLIQCVMLQQGTVDETPFYLSNLLRAAIVTSAQAIVLCHNHPGGTLRPSQDDIRCTLESLRALIPLKILLLDHVIVAGSETVSLRQIGSIPSTLWLEQNLQSKLLLKWQDVEF